MRSLLLSVFRRRSTLPLSAFQSAFRDRHAEVVLRHASTLGLIGYTQLHRVPRAAVTAALRVWRRLRAPYDGMDLWTIDHDTFTAAWQTAAGRAALDAIVHSERAFADPSRSATWHAQGCLLVDDGSPASRGRRKLVWVGRGHASSTDEEFRETYLHTIGKKIRQDAESIGMHRYLQLHTRDDSLTQGLRALRGTAEPYPVAAELTWDMRQLFRGSVAGPLAMADIARDEDALIDFARSAIWLADEHVVLAPPAPRTVSPGPQKYPETAG